MNLFNFSENEILIFFFILLRMSAFVVSWPIFGVQTVPTSVKILFSLVLSIMVYPLANQSNFTSQIGSYELIFVSIKEVFVGLSIGFLARMFLFALSSAGQIMSVSMGLSGVQLFNPASGERSTPLDQFQVFMGSLIFLALYGHHFLISAIFDSYQVVPMSLTGLSVDVFRQIGVYADMVMLIGIKLSAPVMISILLMNIMMGIIGRAVPQINVLITSLPVNILVGFLVLIVSLPVIMEQMDGLLETTSVTLFKVLKSY